MRRRVYIDPESDLRDVTDSPHHFMDDEPWTEPRWCQTGVLEDEALWALYEEACNRANELRCQIIQKLRYEPLDEVEERAARRMDAMLAPVDDAFDDAEWYALERELVENAQRKR